MSNPFFPFRVLGYACNPFKALTPEEWAEVAVLPPEAEAALAAGSHLQVLGRKGRGKSTTLRGLAERLIDGGQAAAYEYIPEGQHHFTTEAAGLHVFLLDEGQRLAPTERLRLVGLARAGVQLVIGSHLTFALDFALRSLPLNTLLLRGHSLAHYQRIVAARLAYFALPHADPLRLTEEAIAAVHAHFGDDLRAAEWFLYEVYQQASEAAPDGPITPAVLAACGLPAGGR